MCLSLSKVKVLVLYISIIEMLGWVGCFRQMLVVFVFPFAQFILEKKAALKYLRFRGASF